MPEFEGFGSQLEGSQLAGSTAYEELIAQYSHAVADAAQHAKNQSKLARKVRAPQLCCRQASMRAHCTACVVLAPRLHTALLEHM